MSTEQDLDSFFTGLDAGMNGLREVRASYDELVAFEFNSTHFFEPNENKTSDILAFFLNPKAEFGQELDLPKATHGQAATFLKVFLEYFDLQYALNLLKAGKRVVVKREHHTFEERRIDVTIHFGVNEYVIGIENKIVEGRDLSNQLNHYSKELAQITHSKDKWILLYLTPHGGNPWEGSIDQNSRENLEGLKRFRKVSYATDIVDILGRFELRCKADNVRAFLKDFKQYLKQLYGGERFMGETNYLEKYVKEHPTIIGNIRPLYAAVEQLRAGYQEKLLSELKRQLDSKGITLCERKSTWWPLTNESVEKLKFCKGEFEIIIDEKLTGLINGVYTWKDADGSWKYRDELKLIQAAMEKDTPERRYQWSNSWGGFFYQLADDLCWSDKQLTKYLQNLNEPTYIPNIVNGMVSQISKFVETLERVCKKQ